MALSDLRLIHIKIFAFEIEFKNISTKNVILIYHAQLGEGAAKGHRTAS